MNLHKLGLLFVGAGAMSLGMLAAGCGSSPGGDTGSDGGASKDSASATGSGSGSHAGSGSGSHAGSGTGPGTSNGTGVGTGAGAGDDDAGAGAGDSGEGDSAVGTGPGTNPSDAGSACAKPPTALHPRDGGLECYIASASGPPTVDTCMAGEHCCEARMGGTSGCTAAATACAAGDPDWICEGPENCAGNPAGAVCCGTGTIATVPACGGNPAFPGVTGFKGTTCAASCASTYVVCLRDSDCAGGSCVPTEPKTGKGRSLGYCSP